MRRLSLILPLALLAATLAGCFNPFSPRVSTQRVASSPPPSPSSPANAVRLFVWCWKNRDPNRYAEVFTEDYRFIFAPNDSAGNPFRDAPWIREAEMDMARHMFVGGGDQPPASDISITIDNSLVARDDTRPEHQNKWHRTIRTHVDLKVTVTDASGTPSVTPVVGNALFYLVRGDSAVIPSELSTRFKPDSTRWWIERWEDETIATGSPNKAFPVAGPYASQPVLQPAVTFGRLKVRWVPGTD